MRDLESVTGPPVEARVEILLDLADGRKIRIEVPKAVQFQTTYVYERAEFSGVGVETILHMPEPLQEFSLNMKPLVDEKNRFMILKVEETR